MQFRLVLGTERAIQQLEVFFAREECVLRCHPHARDDVILDEASKRLTRCGNEVLVVGVSDVIRFCPGNVILYTTDEFAPKRERAEEDARGK